MIAAGIMSIVNKILGITKEVIDTPDEEKQHIENKERKRILKTESKARELLKKALRRRR